MKSELDLFTLPPTQTSVESGSWVMYKPISSLSNDSPIEFSIPPSDEYFDLAHTMLSIKVKMVPKRQGAAIDAAAGPVNNLMHSLFSQVDVYLNDKLVSPPNNSYAYRAYIETLLNYGCDAKSSHLQSVLWYADKAGSMDAGGADNTGLVKRRTHFANGRTVDLIGHLHCDIFNQEKYLLNGVSVRLRLIRSRDNFCLIDAANTSTLNIVEATLIVRRVKISPGILLAHAKTLAHATAKYPMSRVEVKALAIHGGVHGETLDNVFLGQLPKRIILGFVDNASYNGSVATNPFNFKNHGINYLALYVDNVQIPSRALQPDYANNLSVDSFYTLFTGTGIHFSDNGNCIGRSDYPDGYCIQAFDLTADLSANSDTHWNLIKQGSVRIEVRFAEALPATITCIVFGEFDSILEIDASRQVITDFGT